MSFFTLTAHAKMVIDERSIEKTWLEHAIKDPG
jgi:hypothetical protein